MLTTNQVNVLLTDNRPFYELANVNVEISQFENNVHDDLMKVCEKLKQLLYQCTQGKNTWTIDLTIDCSSDSIECLQVNMKILSRKKYLFLYYRQHN